MLSLLIGWYCNWFLSRWFPFLTTRACCEACGNLKAAFLVAVVSYFRLEAFMHMKLSFSIWRFLLLRRQLFRPSRTYISHIYSVLGKVVGLNWPSDKMMYDLSLIMRWSSELCLSQMLEWANLGPNNRFLFSWQYLIYYQLPYYMHASWN